MDQRTVQLATLGNLISDPRATIGGLQASYFDQDLQAVFTTIANRSMPSDQIAHLYQEALAAAARVYLPFATLAQAVVNDSIVRDLYNDPALASGWLDSQVGKMDSTALVDALTLRLQNIAGRTAQMKNPLVKLTDVLTTYEASITDRMALQREFGGMAAGVSVRTGLTALDEFTHGMALPSVVLLGGHSGVGKTWLTLTFVLNAVKQGLDVAFYSLEMTAEQMVGRLIQMVGRINSKKSTMGLLSEEEEEQWRAALGRLNDWGDQITLASVPDGLTIWDIGKQVANAHPDRTRPLMIVIDYPMLLLHQGAAAKDERQALDAIVMEAKRISLALNAVILMPWHLNREAGSGRPNANHIAGTINVVRAADNVYIIHQPDPDEEAYELILAKMRGDAYPKTKGGQRIDTLKLYFDPDTHQASCPPMNGLDLSLI